MPPKTPRARLNSLDAHRQAQLLDPAEAEFAAHGFSDASLNRILAAAGMSKGQAYYYIADKADLYGAVIDRAFRRFVDTLGFTFGTPTTADAFWERVEQLFARISAALLADDRLAALACGFYENETTRAALPEAYLLDRFAHLMTLGRAAGAVRTDVPDSLFMAMSFSMAVEVDRWFAKHWHTLDDAEALRLNQITVGMFRAMASPPA